MALLDFKFYIPKVYLKKRLSPEFRRGNLFWLINITRGREELPFYYSRYDQASIVWHEINHIRNGETKVFPRINLLTPVTLTPPSYVLENLRIFCENKCAQEGIDNSSYWVNVYMQRELLITFVTTEEYYRAEIRCYNAEMKNGIDVSNAYNAERNFLLWKINRV